MKKTVLFSLLFVALFFSSCKKKKDVITPIPKPSETLQIDTDFGDGGSVVFEGVEYRDLNIGNESIVLTSNPGMDEFTTVQKLALSGAPKSYFGTLGYVEFDYFLNGLTLLPENKMEFYVSNTIKVIDKTGDELSATEYPGFNNIITKLSNGKYLAHKYVDGTKLLIIRLNADFSLDGSFTATELPNMYPKFKVEEFNNQYFINASAYSRVYKLNESGGIDLSFGNGGVLSHSGGGSGYNSMCVKDNSLYYAYSNFYNDNTQILVKKYNLDGVEMPNFGNNGTVSLEASSLQRDYNYLINEIVVSDGGNLYVSWSNWFSECNSFLLKISSEGIIDTSIGTDGYFNMGAGLLCRDMKIYKNELYVLYASTYFDSSELFRVKLD